MEDAMTEELDITGMLIDYEQGELESGKMVELFAYLVRTGMAWTLQGHYGRTAKAMMDSGVINTKGEIDWDAYDTLIGE